MLQKAPKKAIACREDWWPPRADKWAARGTWVRLWEPGSLSEDRAIRLSYISPDPLHAKTPLLCHHRLGVQGLQAACTSTCPPGRHSLSISDCLAAAPGLGLLRTQRFFGPASGSYSLIAPTRLSTVGSVLTLRGGWDWLRGPGMKGGHSEWPHLTLRYPVWHLGKPSQATQALK